MAYTQTMLPPNPRASLRDRSRRFALRDATSEVHARLDRAVGDFVDRPAYDAYLRAMVRFRGPAEAAVSGAAWPLDLPWRPTLIEPDLAADAADLRLAPSETRLPLAPPQGSSALLGTLYVLEGATLGSRLLRRRAERLGLDSRFGARHLAVMAERGENWGGFLAHLEASADFDPDAAACAACAAFATALECFESEPRVSP